MNNKYLELAEMAGAKTSLMTNSYKDFLKLYFELIEEYVNEKKMPKESLAADGHDTNGDKRRSNN